MIILRVFFSIVALIASSNYAMKKSKEHLGESGHDTSKKGATSSRVVQRKEPRWKKVSGKKSFKSHKFQESLDKSPESAVKSPAFGSPRVTPKSFKISSKEETEVVLKRFFSVDIAKEFLKEIKKAQGALRILNLHAKACLSVVKQSIAGSIGWQEATIFSLPQAKELIQHVYLLSLKPSEFKAKELATASELGGSFSISQTQVRQHILSENLKKVDELVIGELMGNPITIGNAYRVSKILFGVQRKIEKRIIEKNCTSLFVKIESEDTP